MHRAIAAIAMAHNTTDQNQTGSRQVLKFHDTTGALTTLNNDPAALTLTTGVADTRITVMQSGVYRVSACISWYGKAAYSTKFDLGHNTVEINGTYTQIIGQGYYAHDKMNFSLAAIVVARKGDYFQVYLDGTACSPTRPLDATFLVERVDL